MSRTSLLLPAALLAAWLCLVAGGCSRPSSGDGSGAVAGASNRPLPPAPASTPAPAPAVSASPSALPMPTPEDAEDDAEHRITDQNLESELDRLEREIQAE